MYLWATEIVGLPIRLFRHPKRSKKQLLYATEGDKFYISTGESGVVYLIQWFDSSYVRMRSYTDLKNSPDDKKTDDKRATAWVNFKGKGSTLPISLSGYVDLWGKIRVGLST
jgi:hypothetical protein